MQWLSFETAYSVVIYLLLVLISLTFLKYALFSKQTEHPGVQKIIGGLTVFIVALLSQNDLVTFASLFIGGLIIASEEFMQNLAIILRSRSEDIQKNLNTRKASEKEVAEKRREETEQLKHTPAGVKKSEQKLLKTAQKAEALVSEYFSRKFGELYQSQMKVSVPVAGPSLVVDGVIKTPENRTYSLIETKYVLEIEQAPEILSQSLKRIRSVFDDQRLIVCLVSEAKTFADTEAVLSLFDSFKELQDQNSGLILFTADGKEAIPVFGDPFVGD